MPAIKSILVLRANIIQAIRDFFFNRRYLEVETPNLVYAPAPEVHIDAVKAGSGFMQTSPELCMKRLLSAGYSRIFQICKCYREGERGNLHLPEFTILEWYRTNADYMTLMSECEDMILFIAEELKTGININYREKKIELQKPWERLTVNEAFRRYSSVSLEDALEAGRFDEIMVCDIEPMFCNRKPVFLYDYPSSLAALSRKKGEQSELAERFELYVGGLELANAFSELTDPFEQAERFKRDVEIRKKLGKKEYPFPEKFINDLERMPESAGIAFGIDRLVMLFADKSKIDDVVSFTPEDL